MIVRNIEELAGSARDVAGPGWRSRRLLLRDDATGHSLHYTELEAGAQIELCYRHHIESNLCIAGTGEVVELATGATYPLRPGVMYALDRHDAHLLRAHTALTLICIFTPALVGTETHDASGSYPPPDDATPAPPSQD
jgi:L-ectoine synthase